MKTKQTPLPALDLELRAAIEDVLKPGETISSFVAQSIRDAVRHRRARQEFIAGRLKPTEVAGSVEDYVSAATVLSRLEATLEKAKRKAPKVRA